MSITRRLFLRNTAAVGAVGAVATPVVANAASRSPRDQVIWHMREIERLVLDGGADTVHITAIGTYGHHSNVRLIGIHYSGKIMDRDGMFAGKGGAA